ncbi:MAG: CoA pyrophosphatase [Rhodanobacteraceae bacterium]|nr:CoA pyrophosphatase [Rhodanobacteraceae bacterium]
MSTVPPLRALSSLPGFDPRQVPVTGVDTHLPAVARSELSAQALRERFGISRIWTPEIVAEPSFSDRQLTPASVLLAITTHDEPRVVLTQRTAHLSSHSGQIAFPGGKQDANDTDHTTTALREAHEEIGLEAGFVQVLGALPAYRTGSAFIVTPVVALLRDGYSVRRNAYEVDDIFEVPLAYLMDPANHRHHVVQIDGVTREWLSIPYLDGATERFIWGATAGMLRNFYRFLSA